MSSVEHTFGRTLNSLKSQLGQNKRTIKNESSITYPSMFQPCPLVKSDVGKLQCEQTNSPLNPSGVFGAPPLTSPRAGPGQSAAPAGRPAAARTQGRHQDSSGWWDSPLECESIPWCSPETPLSQQFSLCLWETGSDPGGALHRPCPPGDQMETQGQLVEQKPPKAWRNSECLVWGRPSEPPDADCVA